jgi:hypothetical protein
MYVSHLYFSDCFPYSLPVELPQLSRLQGFKVIVCDVHHYRVCDVHHYRCDAARRWQAHTRNGLMHRSRLQLAA